MSERPPLSVLLADPAGVVLRTDLLTAGWPERAVDALFCEYGRRIPGYTRPFVPAGVIHNVMTNNVVKNITTNITTTAVASSTAPATIPHRVPGTAYIIARGEGPRRRFLVRFKLGGRAAKIEHAGSFRTKRDAVLRRNWVISLIAAGKGAEVRGLLRANPDNPGTAITLRTAATRWQASRVDVSPGTAQTYRVALRRILPTIGEKSLDEIDVAAITDLVSELSGLERESIRKTLSVLAQVLDHARVQPNPVRDPLVKLPRGERKEVNPPTAEHVEAVHRLLPARYKLPLLILDATGMRIGELQALVWGDIDEPHARWRVCAGVSKTGTARWVQPRPNCSRPSPRSWRERTAPPTGGCSLGFGSDRFRTALTRACTAAGIPAFSPHDLRHRRVSLLHLGGMPLARIGEMVGHGDIVTTARTYTHVVASEDELDYAGLLDRRRERQEENE